MYAHGIKGWSGSMILYGLFLRVHKGLKSYTEQELQYRAFPGKYPEVLDFLEEQLKRSIVFEANAVLRDAQRKDLRNKVQKERRCNPNTGQYRIDFD